MSKSALLPWMIPVALAGCTAHADPPPEPLERTPPQVASASESPEPATQDPIPAPPPSMHWTSARCDLPPVSLTASDGSGLELTQFRAEAVIHGPLAFTEIHLAFHNPEPREIEGRFSVTLPGDAAISRMAMQIGDRWQEGEVVEKQAARVAYEDFLHRKQDPALMEREAGNVYSARVFPIPANGDKHLIVSYSQELAGREPYRLPLCGLPKVHALDIDIHVERPEVVDRSSWTSQGFSDHLRDEAPSGDIEVHGLGTDEPYALRSDNLAIVSLTPKLDAVAQPIARAVILFDTSASRANDFAGQVARLGELVRALGSAQPGLEVDVIGFDQAAERVFSGRAVEFGELAEDRLRRRGPLGASALDVALDAVAEHEVVPDRLILISDGMLTAGAELGDLGERLRALEESGLRRIDVIADGNAADHTALETLARGELPEHGVVLRGSSPLPELVRRIGAATRSGIAVEVEGASWVWPRQLDGVQPGDAVLVHAKLDAPVGERLRVRVGGEPVEVLTLDAPRPLLERAQARATIAGLEAELLGGLSPAQESAVRADIVEASVRARVLSDLTALLVLETEDDYAQFGIERDALADILTIGDAGVELRRRGDAVVVQDKRASARADRVQAVDDPLASGDELGVLGGVEGGVPGGVPGGVVGGVSFGLAGAVATGAAASPRVAAGRMLSNNDAPANLASEVVQPVPKVDPLPRPNAHTGRYGRITRSLERGQVDEAVADARAWVAEAPGDVLALVALGDALAAANEPSEAVRAYGSLIDLHPSRADIRRMAGARLEALGELGLAEDSYRRAIEQRPDHPSGYRLLAWVLIKQGRAEDAFELLCRGLERDYPEDRYLGVETLLRQDLGIVAAIWIAREPEREAEIRERTVAHYTRVDNRYSLRFVLNWETDANDVDLHVWDGDRDHAYYGEKTLGSGGELVADVTTGYGPEGFVMFGRKSGFPYRLYAHYYSRGAMGYGMGKLEVLEHDGHGNVAFSEHPFVVMKDDAWVELTTLRRRLL